MSTITDAHWREFERDLTNVYTNVNTQHFDAIVNMEHVKEFTSTMMRAIGKLGIKDWKTMPSMDLAFFAVKGGMPEEDFINCMKKTIRTYNRVNQ